MLSVLFSNSADHDNASAHTANATVDFLQANSVRPLTHPPYSPDLAPCDFFLFPTVKKNLRGERFASPEDAVRVYEDEIAALSQTDWSSCFSSWFHRMKRCVESHGEYFEKM